MSVLEQAVRVENFHAKMERDILVYGCSIVGVCPSQDDPQPPFSYTIGLTEFGWPELIMVGLRNEYAAQIINTMVQEYRDKNAVPTAGDLLTECSNLPLRLGSASAKSVEEYLCQAVYRQERVRGSPVTALQVVMCDRESRFPGDAEYDHAYMDPRQPCLATQGEWDCAAP